MLVALGGFGEMEVVKLPPCPHTLSTVVSGKEDEAKVALTSPSSSAIAAKLPAMPRFFLVVTALN